LELEAFGQGFGKLAAKKSAPESGALNGLSISQE
jgi:hypothetical protein